MYKEEKQTIKVPLTLANHIEKLLSKEPKNEDECFGENDVICLTVNFNDGYEIDIKLCGVNFDPESESNLPWTEAVLFHNGAEVTYSEPNETFFGQGYLINNNIKYIVNVVQEK